MLVAGQMDQKKNSPVKVTESWRIAKALGERVTVDFQFGYLKRARPPIQEYV